MTSKTRYILNLECSSMKQHTSTSLKKTAKTLPLSFFLLILDHKQFLTYFFSDDVKIEENVFET